MLGGSSAKCESAVHLMQLLFEAEISAPGSLFLPRFLFQILRSGCENVRFDIHDNIDILLPMIGVLDQSLDRFHLQLQFGLMVWDCTHRGFLGTRTPDRKLRTLGTDSPVVSDNDSACKKSEGDLTLGIVFGTNDDGCSELHWRLVLFLNP